MRNEEVARRFGPERWVTVRATGEHVKVEAWSPIASRYRVRSHKSGILLVADDELDAVPVHPDAELHKNWTRCQISGCGAPLTPELTICEVCHAPTCTCGRCRCTPQTKRSAAAKKARRKTAPKAKGTAAGAAPS